MSDESDSIPSVPVAWLRELLDELAVPHRIDRNQPGSDIYEVRMYGFHYDFVRDNGWSPPHDS